MSDRYIVIDNLKMETGKVVVWETAFVLFEFDEGENPWGGPLRKWFPRAFFMEHRPSVKKIDS